MIPFRILKHSLSKLTTFKKGSKNFFVNIDSRNNNALTLCVKYGMKPGYRNKSVYLDFQDRYRMKAETILIIGIEIRNNTSEIGINAK